MSALDVLLQSLELEATLFHAGQYCGAFRASTAGARRAAFHLVVHGGCYLHLPDQPSLRLSEGDAVFFLRDTPHALTDQASAREGFRASVRHGTLTPMTPAREDAVGLVCGFFDFKPGLSERVVASLPVQILARADAPDAEAMRSVFRLIADEARAGEAHASSAVIERLTGVLLFYALRHAARDDGALPGLLRLAARDEFAPLLARLLDDPGRPWTLCEMARVVHMSRASFVKHFSQAAGCSPGNLLLLLRMRRAERLLRHGETVAEVAAQVGYQSTAAFSRAFTKLTGAHPGGYRRQRGDAAPAGLPFTPRPASSGVRLQSALSSI
ncbi:MAG: AraC family transcriptional regulator [Polyangiales bacterium]